MSRVRVRDASDGDIPLLVDFVVAEAREAEVWLRLVAAARRRAFYRRELLFSLEARATFVAPDLAELP
jgi:hypothetical protein